MKLLIIAACLINFGDDAGGVAHDVGEMPDVPKETARALTSADRALYVNRADDHTKEYRYTASREMIEAAMDAADEKAAAAAAKSPSKSAA